MNKAIFASLLLFSGPSAAEVSDKIPSISEMIWWGLALGLATLVLCCFRWWFSCLAVLLAIFLALGVFGLWEEPYMREAVLHEQGIEYFVVMGAQSALVLLGAGVGSWLSPSRRKGARPTS